MTKEYTFNNIQFESNVTFYLTCAVCEEELRCHVPEKVNRADQEFNVTVIPHECEE